MKIPNIIHQTWKTHNIPFSYRGWVASWYIKHDMEKWRYVLYSDDDNRSFIERIYPWFLPVYDGYSEHIMRVDAVRYFLLHHHGGVYVDLDFECLHAIDSLIEDREIVLGEEPASHTLNIQRKAQQFGSIQLDTVVCNAFIASVPNHPFWEQVFIMLKERAFEDDPLYATGPLLLSEAWARFKDKPKNTLVPSVQLYPINAEEALLSDADSLVHRRARESNLTVYAVHHWMGSWIKGSRLRRRLEQMIRAMRRSSYVPVARLLHLVYIALRFIKSTALKMRLMLRTPIALSSDVQPSRPLLPKELEQDILVAVPVKNAEKFLPIFLRNFARLSYPHKHLHLAFLESDSEDNTWGWLNTHAPRLREEYGSVQLYQEHYRYRSKGARYRAQEQLTRRSILAKSRNRLLELALGKQSWVLWIDVDVAWWPPKVLECLLAENKSIIVPNCLTPYGACFDLNNFKFNGKVNEQGWQKYLVNGIIQPPAGVGRQYLNDFLGMGCVPLDAVGGTMLLVKAEIHKRGIVFPDRPYKFYIETEGFAVEAADKGYSAWGVPDLNIIHPLY